MNRREFLKSLAAIGWSATVPAIALATAPEEIIDDVWSKAVENPVVFYVTSWGTLSYGHEDDYPKTRSALFGLSPLVSRQDLLSLREELSTFEWFLENQWLKHADDDQLYDDDDPDTFQASSFEDWESWLDAAPDEVIDGVVQRANDWLEEFPNDTDWEIGDLRGYTDRGAALSYFRDTFEYCDDFNIVIVEGDHPGSTYYAAELLTSVEEANEVAASLELPIRFEWES